MSAISGWILSILGIIVLSILIDLILPDGKTTGFIKNFFSYLIIIVVLSPIFSFFTNKEYNVNSIFETSTVEIQEEYIAKVNRQILDTTAKEIEKECYDLGIKGIEVGFTADIFENKLNIKQVNIDLKKIVIVGNFEHNNIKTSIADIVVKHIVVDKEIIVFYE